MPFFFEILINVNLRGVMMSEKSEDLNSSSFRLLLLPLHPRYM